MATEFPGYFSVLVLLGGVVSWLLTGVSPEPVDSADCIVEGGCETKLCAVILDGCVMCHSIEHTSGMFLFAWFSLTSW